jgi:hypothetical protein
MLDVVWFKLMASVVVISLLCVSHSGQDGSHLMQDLLGDLVVL